MGSRTGRSYTPDEKRRATERASLIGAQKASVELGVPSGTLSCWVFHARQREMSAGAVAAVVSGVTGTGGAASTVGLALETPGAVPVSQTLPVASVPVASSVTLEAPAAAAVSRTSPVASVPVASSTSGGAVRRARVAKVYTPSQVAQALERITAIGVRPAAKELGISRTTLRDWERKTARAAQGDGVAPTSGPDPKTAASERDARVLAEWKKQVGLGPSQIRNQLRRAGMTVSTQTVRRVMEEAGYQPPKVERKAHDGRYEAVHPNQLWHLDFVHRYIHQQKVFVLALLDDYSRLCGAAHKRDTLPILPELLPYLTAVLDDPNRRYLFGKSGGAERRYLFGKSGGAERRDEGHNPTAILHTAMKRAADAGMASLATDYELRCRRKDCGHVESVPAPRPEARCPSCGMKLWQVTNVRQLRFHDLRHTYATLLIEGGASPKAVQELMRHRSITTTIGTYAHVNVAFVRGEQAKLFGAVRAINDGLGEGK